MIVFKQLDIQSFKSIFKCSINFDSLDSGLYSLEGVNHTTDFAQSNGSGKSTLIQALMFALYGTVDDIYIKNSEYQNKRTSLSLEIKLDLEIQGILYSIRRTLKTFELFRDGEDISELTKTDTENKFQSILNLTKAEFISFTYLSQSSTGGFLSKTPSEKLNCIKDFIFGEDLNTIQNKLKKLITKYNNSISEVSNKKSSVEGELKVLQRLLDSTKNEKEVKLVNYPYSVEEYKQQLEDVNRLQKRAMELTTKKQILSREFNRYQQQARDIKSELESLNNNICPTCGQLLLVSDQFKQNLKVKIKNLRQSMTSLKQEIEDVNTEIKNIPNTDNLSRQHSELSKIIFELTESKKSKSIVDIESISNDIQIKQQEQNKYVEQLDKYNFNLQVLNSLQKYFKEQFIQYIQKAFLTEIENYLNLYCYDVFNEDFKLSFTGKSLDITVGGKPYSYFSGGERQRLDFLFVFAIKIALMSFTNKSTNLFICDESLSGQDMRAFNSCLNLIASLTQSEDIVTILVSHRDTELQENKIIIERFNDRTKLNIIKV